MTLQTREPTGVVPWPLLLIEGDEKSGKSWCCAEFTGSERVGQAYWIDLGQGSGDEYRDVPGAKFRMVMYDGSFPALCQKVAEIHAEARKVMDEGGKPVVLIIDDMTAEWDLLKDWATDRARSSRSNRAKLERDPNAEITVSGNYWNDANDRHKRLMRLLKAFPGIVLMVAHGKEVAVIGQDGQPVEGKKTHKVEAQKSLGADASLWLRLFREEPGIIVGGRSVHLKFRPGDKPRLLAADWTLENVIFDVLKCDPATAQARDVIEPKADSVTPEQIRDEALNPRTTVARIRELWAEAKRLGYDEVSLMNETGDDENLIALLARVGKERAAEHAGLSTAQGAAAAESPPPTVQSQAAAPAAGDPWADEPQPGSDPWTAAATAPASTPAQQPASPATAGDDPEFMGAFFGRLSETPADKLGDRQREVSAAIRDGIITPKTGGDLSTAIRARRTDLAKPAEPAIA